MSDEQTRCKAVHDALQECVREDGVVVSWAAIIEVLDSEGNRKITRLNISDSDDAATMTPWAELGLIEVANMMAYDELRETIEEDEGE